MKKFYPVLLLIILIASAQSRAQYPLFNVTAHTPASTGFYYFCPYILSGFAASFPPGTQRQMVLDRNGEVVYYKPFTGYFAGDFKQQRNGLITYVDDNRFMIMDSTFTIIDSVTTQGVVFDLHDLQILPNKHYLLLGDKDTVMDLSSYHMFYNNGTRGSTHATVTAGVVQELDSAKNVVFEWRSINHFNFNDVDSFFLLDSAHVDWTHMNAVEMDHDGNILISSRHFDEITKINRTDSSIIWRMGGKRNQFNFVNDSGMFRAQHDIRRLPNGHITLFDNGRQSPLHITSAKEYILDETNHIATLAWSHNEGPTVFSRSQGNCQRLHNGNTLISYGNIINENIVFNVVDSTGNKVFEVSFPDSELTYRSFNFDSVPWLYNRPHITCYRDSTHNYLVADSGYASYNWSTGDTTQTITASLNDTVSVFVPIGDGGYISSRKFIVINAADPVASGNSICGPGTVSLSATSTDSIFWFSSNSGGTPLGSGHSFTTPSITHSTDYYAQAENKGCPSHRIPASATINPLPIINLGPDTLIINPVPYVLDAGTGYNTYHWTTGDTLQTLIVQPFNNDTFCVTVSDSNECVDSDCVVVTFWEGISNIEGNNLFTVYPNPSSGQFTLEMNSIISSSDIEIRNITGQIIERMNSVKTPSLQLDLTSYPKGIYFIRLNSNLNSEFRKIIIE